MQSTVFSNVITRRAPLLRLQLHAGPGPTYVDNSYSLLNASCTRMAFRM